MISLQFFKKEVKGFKVLAARANSVKTKCYFSCPWSDIDICVSLRVFKSMIELMSTSNITRRDHLVSVCRLYLLHGV